MWVWGWDTLARGDEVSSLKRIPDEPHIALYHILLITAFISKALSQFRTSLFLWLNYKRHSLMFWPQTASPSNCHAERGQILGNRWSRINSQKGTVQQPTRTYIDQQILGKWIWIREPSVESIPGQFSGYCFLVDWVRGSSNAVADFCRIETE